MTMPSDRDISSENPWFPRHVPSYQKIKTGHSATLYAVFMPIPVGLVIGGSAGLAIGTCSAIAGVRGTIATVICFAAGYILRVAGEYLCNGRPCNNQSAKGMQ